MSTETNTNTEQAADAESAADTVQTADAENVVVRNVRAALMAAGLADTVVLVTDSVATAATAAAVLGCEVGAIANSLIFECAGEPLLILASGAAKVDTKKVAREHGLAKINRASAEFVLEFAGQPVGGVAPLGHPAPIRAFLDRELAQYPVLWAGAGSHQAMLSLNYQQLKDTTGATETAVR